MSEFIEVVCPKCHENVQAAADRAGTLSHCPSCRAQLPIAGVAGTETSDELLPREIIELEEPGQPQPRARISSRSRALATLLPVLFLMIGVPVAALVACLYHFNLIGPLWPASGQPTNTKNNGPNWAEPALVVGTMPTKDPQQEAKLAAERNTKILALQAVEKKTLEVLKKMAGNPEVQEGDSFHVSFGELKTTAVQSWLAPNGHLLLVQFHTWETKTSEFKVFDLTTGKCVCQFSYSGTQLQTVISPDSTQLVQGGFDNKVTVRDLKQGKILHSFPTERPIWNLALAPDGQQLVASVEGKLLLFDRETGQICKSFSGSLNAAHPVLSPSGVLLAASIGFDNATVALWEVASGGKIQEFPVNGSVQHLLFTPDGWRLIVHTDKGFTVRDLETNQTRIQVEAPWAGFPTLSPDGKYLAYLSSGTLVLLNVDTGKEIRRVKHVSGELRFFPGSSLLTAFDTALRVWDFAELLDPPADKAVAVPPGLEGEARAEYVFKKLGGSLYHEFNDPAKPITTMHLDYKKVSNNRLKEIIGLKHLKKLQLSGTLVTAAGLKHLTGLPHLEELGLGDIVTKDAELKELAGLKNLKSLSLSFSEITGTGLKDLADLSNLQSLRLYHCQVTDEGLKSLIALQNLTNLSLACTKVTDAGMKHLRALQDLEELDLGFTKITDAGLEELATLTSLLKLTLRNTKVTGVGLKGFAAGTDLQYLELSYTKANDAGMKNIGQLKSLETLLLFNTPVTSAGLKHLAGLENLRTLDLSYTQVTDAGLKDLGGLKGLTTLHLSKTAVTDAGLKELTMLQSLTTLSLNQTNVTAEGVQELRKALPKCFIFTN